MVQFAVLLLTLITSTCARAAPTTPLNDAAILKNAQEAQKQNVAFQTLKETDPCTADDKACIGGAVAVCQDKWVVAPGKCSNSQTCFALPSVREPGTLVTCTSEKNALAAFEAAGASGGILGDENANESTPPCQGDQDSDTGCSAPTGSTSRDSNPSSTTPSTTARNPTSPPTSTPSQNSKSAPRTSSSTSTSSQAVESSKSTASQPTNTSESPDQDTVTVTITLNGSTTLPPTTRTLSPQEASSVLSSLMANGATIIEAPTPTTDRLITTPTFTPSSAVPSDGSSPTKVPIATPDATASGALPTESVTFPSNSVYDY